MTTNVLSERSGKPSASTAIGGWEIGATGAGVFNCPSCARPLADGTPQCVGCGARLIMGVLLKRAGAILALGIVLGALIGGVTMASAITISLRGTSAVAAVVPSAPPAAAHASTAPTAVGAVPVPGVPQAAIAALSGTAALNSRIAVDTDTLGSTVTATDATSTEIARGIRALAADAALGIDLTARLATWRDAGPAMADLNDFYRTMAESARVALRASPTDTAAYRKAGGQMLTVLAGLGSVDATSRTLAATIDLELPPLTAPGQASSAGSFPGVPSAP